MKIKFILFTGVLALGASLQASTSLDITLASVSGYSNLNVGGYIMSPYTGVLGGTYTGGTLTSGGASGNGYYTGGTLTGGSAITLFCDDFNDGASLNQQYVSENVSTGSAGGFTSAEIATGRFALLPAATTLYDELAWLATQMQGATYGNEVQIQEAIWQLTDTTANKSVSPTSSAGTGQTQTYSQWMADAAADWNKTVTGYLTVNYAGWEIVTQTSAADQQSGLGTQEFLAYQGGPGTVVTQSAVPEPASFLLIGSGLLAGAVFGRRRIKKSNS
jgi:hypothetical protein